MVGNWYMKLLSTTLGPGLSKKVTSFKNSISAQCTHAHSCIHAASVE